jgi:DNA-binding NarL/FixJ family response regulator
MPGRIRVVLADDHAAILETVRKVLADNFEVIASVEDGQQALDAVRRLDPDVLVTDISMPVVDGLQVSKRLQQANCRTKVVILTIHEDPDFITAAMAAGASGYVAKSRLSSDLALAIHEALQGRTFVSHAIRS